MKQLEKLIISNFLNEKGQLYKQIPLFYQSFGLPLGTAEVIVVNHALTGNSEVTGSKGWWKKLIGDDKIIDTNKFTILSFNIPGNGYDGNADNLIENYPDFTARDIASLFLLGLKHLQVEKIYALIGGSLGGGIAWEMVALQTDYIQHLIPIAADWKASNWVIANCLIQDTILKNSVNPVHDARLNAMMLYRTPQSFRKEFNRSFNNDENVFSIEEWLLHHGSKLKKHFELSSYLLMNHLLKTIDITRGRGSFKEVIQTVKSSIHLITVDTDLLFTADENKETFEVLKTIKSNVFYHKIESVHGHDAFLIEYEQLSKIIGSIFNLQKNISYANS